MKGIPLIQTNDPALIARGYNLGLKLVPNLLQVMTEAQLEHFESNLPELQTLSAKICEAGGDMALVQEIVSTEAKPKKGATRIEPVSTQVPVLHTPGNSTVIFEWLDHWKLFCREFNLKEEIDFAAAKEKALTRPKGFDWVIYTPSGFTSRESIDRLCAPQFTVYESNPVQSYRLERQPDKARLILCRPNIEPDSEWRVSSNTMAATTTPFLDCREGYILEGFYCHFKKKHLNINGWTRFPRSRAGRLVADVRRCEAREEFYVDCGGPDGGFPCGGGREVVILLP